VKPAMNRRLKTNLRRRRNGFVLLLTLVLLTLAALATVSMSRACMMRAQAVTEQQLQLQQRWGVITCRAVLLPQAQALLASAGKEARHPVAVCQRSLRLGDLKFDLLFQDESAKASVSTLIRRQGREQAELTIRRLCLASPSAAGSVHLRWESNRPGPDSFGEVFENSSQPSLFDGSFGTPPVQVITCWGDGRLNIHNAGEDVLREFCAGALDMNQVHALVLLQNSEPGISLEDALSKVQVSRQNGLMAEQLLTDSSNCSSLWINCQTARRNYWSLAVAVPGQPIRVMEW
jgi:hypothetical protein